VTRTIHFDKFGETHSSITASKGGGTENDKLKTGFHALFNKLIRGFEASISCTFKLMTFYM